MRLQSVSEGGLIALDQLRANKLRSALTILGVVIGVATVMAMASIVQGIRDQIINTIEVAGPTTFYILRFWSTTPLNPDALPREVRIRPVIRPAEAEAIARLPVFRYDETNALWIVVKPNDGITVSRAMDEVTVQLRRVRGLRAGDPNSFDLITQDQILDVFNKLTGVFFLVMLVLSSVALMVGGIGVMAIMMVSVTDRTREIGVRKALGATRREILWQFLVEAATLTLLGGVLG